MTFNEERIAFDMNSFKFNRTDENLFKQHWEMLNVFELQRASDSLDQVAENKYKELQSFVRPYYYFSKSKADSSGAVTLSNVIAVKTKERDITSHFHDKPTNVIYANALNSARSVKNIVEYSIGEYKDLTKLRVRHKIEWHRKFILSVACIVMFFIGAPLGSIIRKGGFGLPIVVSVLLYVSYHIVSLSGEKAAKTDAWSPMEGMWFGIMVYIPIAFFITYQAANDSGLFDKSIFKKIGKPFVRLFGKKTLVNS
jgi:lipopolysaccharide export system permease protein